ncbi:MAG: hypothetical protein JXJ04_11530 [Spirochaetales bacterium]|nr:hypothetical protein [Spirochaetales bacterium]
MRVAVIFFSTDKRTQLIDISKALVRGIESQGHQVDLIDGLKNIGKKLTAYQYIVLGTESLGFMGKIPEKISSFLSHAGMIGGKRCSAFIIKALLGTQKALLNLMKLMEQEGMYLTFSDIFESTGHAEMIGKKLHVSYK